MKGKQKTCQNCGNNFLMMNGNRNYCSGNCKSLSNSKKAKNNNALNQGSKLDYARLTFILSFIGFLGSIGFYFGVLREVYSPKRDKHQIEQLKAENAQLHKTITLLIEKKGEH